MSTSKHEPVHPGQVLKQDFLEPMGISQKGLSREIGISAQQIGRIIMGTRSITADTALRLSRFFGTSAQVWMGLQSSYDLDKAEDESGRQIRNYIKPHKTYNTQEGR